jgi:hypothetical protein
MAKRKPRPRAKPRDEPTDPGLSAAELQAELAIDGRQLAAWIRDGLPRTGRGKHARFDPAAVAAWLTERGLAEPAEPSAPAEQSNAPLPDAPPPAAIATTRAEAALFLGVNLRTLAGWLTDPTFPGKAGSPGRTDGYFPLERINAWRAARFGLDHRSTAQTDETDAVKLKKALIEIDREQYEFEKELATILDFETMARASERGIATAKAQLQQLADMIDARLPAAAGRKTRKAIRRAVLECVEAVCDTLADAAMGDTDEGDEETGDGDQGTEASADD